MPDPKGDVWLLLYDYCMTDRFGASSSKDLFHWKVEEDVSFPPDARHGSFFKPTASEMKALEKQFSHEY